MRGCLSSNPLSAKYNGIPYAYGDKTYDMINPDNPILDLDVVCLNENDVLSVQSKVPKEVFKQVIDLQTKRLYCAGEGEVSNIGSISSHLVSSWSASQGDVIVIGEFENRELIGEKYYYVCAIDEKSNKYITFEITEDYYGVAGDEKIRFSYLDIDQLVLRVDKIDSPQKAGYLSSCTPYHLPFLNKIVGLKFRYGLSFLLIVQKVDDLYACVDVSDGINPEIKEIIFLPQTTPLLEATAVPKISCQSIIKAAKEYMRKNQEQVNQAKLLALSL